MSKLEKPLDRHLFFRFKMRAKRRTDGPFLRMLNWLFDKIADYGWGVGRTFAWWFGLWAVSGLVLFANTSCATTYCRMVEVTLGRSRDRILPTHTPFSASPLKGDILLHVKSC